MKRALCKPFLKWRLKRHEVSERKENLRYSKYWADMAGALYHSGAGTQENRFFLPCVALHDTLIKFICLKKLCNGPIDFQINSGSFNRRCRSTIYLKLPVHLETVLGRNVKGVISDQSAQQHSCVCEHQTAEQLKQCPTLDGSNMNQEPDF